MTQLKKIFSVGLLVAVPFIFTSSSATGAMLPLEKRSPPTFFQPIQTNQWNVKVKEGTDPKVISDALKGAPFEEVGFSGWITFALSSDVSNDEAKRILNDFKTKGMILEYANNEINTHRYSVK